MQDTAECPYCDVMLSLADVLDSECTGNAIINHCIGTCPQCGKVFSWEEVFDRIGVDELKEEEM
jgi:hypothetical protein